MRKPMWDIGQQSMSLIRKKVGFLRITQKQEYRQTYEVAAWYTDYESDLGDFDLFLGQDYLYPEQLHVYADIPGTVVANYHATLFGGVAIGKSRDDRGNRGTFPIKCAWPEAAIRDDIGKCLPKGVKFYISLDCMGAAIEYAENAMRHYADGFAARHQTYLDEPRNAHNSNISMLGHYGEHIDKFAGLLMELFHHLNWRTKNPSYERVQGGLEPAPEEMVAV